MTSIAPDDNRAEPVNLADIDAVIADATAAFNALQKEDGHFEFDLEADTTISSEYIMLNHFLDELEPETEDDLAAYIRRCQSADGSWPLFYGGDGDISASVKAYLALKLVGDDPGAPHMAKARDAIHKMGGAENANVFTRYALALFGEIPWHGVPVMPIELMLMPAWFPVNMDRFSYWSRTVIAPLLILATLKPKARNPRDVHIRELFLKPPEQIGEFSQNPTGSRWGEFFLKLDKVLRRVERHFPKGSRRKAIKRAEAFIKERLNGEDGLGAIFPAMANTVMAFETLGYAKHDPSLVAAKTSVKKLLTQGPRGERFCQPCISPVWDTALGGHALLEAGHSAHDNVLDPAWDWLLDRQILDVKGDWAHTRPDLRPGGWAFQNRNDYYPDVDDTAVVGMALHRADPEKYATAISRAAEWIIGIQDEDGGWGAFDPGNKDYYLNNIPFADHGALLDPPTADVTARCIGFLAQIGYERSHPAIDSAVAYLRREQEADGSWFGRWGTNYVYGTWSVLCALNAAGEDPQEPYIRKAVAWLESRQRADGGWGEDGATYWLERRTECQESTPSQTAWAVLALMAVGETNGEAVKRGVAYLMKAPREGSKWTEPWFTAVGFPRVFYLRYDGYSRFFPIWALARYRNLTRSNDKTVAWGM
ncbi:MAG TPA: squalene--hopene cyclase [Alphaproteobacteria bacterium]|nr:squalene--hopene cyclase [Alphaproteobacteria bacterium]